MALTSHEVRNIYGKRAHHYDLTHQLYVLVGVRIDAYRRRAIAELQLKPGNLVVELGCGTGINFERLEREVGPGGRLIGVDITPEMLEQARSRVQESEWKNVTLVESDMAEFEFPAEVDGIISAGALSYVSEYDQVVAKAARSLRPGGRLVIFDLKLPEKWPSVLVKLLLLSMRPFGVTLDSAARRPWVSMQRYFEEFSMEERYGGAAYLAIGIKGGSRGLS